MLIFDMFVKPYIEFVAFYTMAFHDFCWFSKYETKVFKWEMKAISQAVGLVVFSHELFL